MAVEDLVQAVREGLSAYLKAQLAATYPTLVTYQHWPEANSLGEFTIAVLDSGDAETMQFPPKVISVVPDAGPAITGTVVYTYGRCEDLPLQLECFASNPVNRDALARDLRRILKQPPSITLATGVYEPLQRDVALVIPVTGLYGQTCEYEFTPLQATPESSESTETNAWRASWKGSARFSLVEQQAGVVLRKRLLLRIGAGELATFTNPRETRTAQGVTLRVVPASVSMARPGSQKLVVVATFQGGMTADVTKFCAFSSSAPLIASVDATGRVLLSDTAGTATITVSYGGATATVAITST